MIEAREFDSAGEVLAAAAALRKKFYPQNPKSGKSDASPDSGKSVKLARLKPVVKRVADPVRVPVNMWEKANLTFNAHVLDYRAHMLRMELDASGDLDDETPQQERRPVIDIVLEVLVDFPGITVDDLKGLHRNRRVVRPRQLAMFEVYRQRADLSFPWIGRWFGGRDHTTVLHAVRKIEAERVVA